MNRTVLYDMTVAERSRLAQLLAGLGTEEWAAQSLCSDWRIREVVAHLNTSETQTWEDFEASVEAAQGDINVACDRTARADTARFSDAELVEIYRRRVPSRWTPGPGNQQGALAHEVIHGLDITVPLGLPGPAAEVVAAAMSDGSPESYAFFGVDLTGLRLIAEDADLTIDAAPAGVTEVRLPATDVLLIVTGRAPLPQVPAEGR